MPEQEDIVAQQQLLRTYRRTLAHHLTQRAMHGTANMPPAVTHGILEARDNIRYLKRALRDWDVPVDDLPGDEEAADLLHDQQAIRLAHGEITTSGINAPPMKHAANIPGQTAAQVVSSLSGTMLIGNDHGTYMCAQNGEATFEIWGEVLNGLDTPVYNVQSTVVLFDSNDDVIAVAMSHITPYPGSTNFIEEGGRRPFRYAYTASSQALPPVARYQFEPCSYSFKSNQWVSLPFQPTHEGYHVTMSNPYHSAVEYPAVITTLYNADRTVTAARHGGGTTTIIYPGYSYTLGLVHSGEEDIPYNTVCVGRLRS